MLILLICLAALWLAWSNGANDNFKGVATLYGSDTVTYRGALAWTTATTFAGALLSVLLAGELAHTFSGKGLVPPDIASSLPFIGAVLISAAATVFVATLIGMPTSTTHALTGAICGAALMGHASVHWGVLGSKFAVPLLVSPVLAVLLAALLYLGARALRRGLGVTKTTCLCIGRKRVPIAAPIAEGAAARVALSPELPIPQVSIGENAVCRDVYNGAVAGVQAQTAVDGLHILSGGAVCFSRALNDTPKIAALLLIAPVLSSRLDVLLIALAMTIGGLLQSRGVAHTMGKRITELNYGQGLTANLTTAFLVLVASKFGVPVSTTHVSCGSIFGIGLVKRRGNRRVIAEILTVWVTTLPFAALLAAAMIRWLGRM